MSADLQARYDLLVLEKQRLEREGGDARALLGDVMEHLGHVGKVSLDDPPQWTLRQAVEVLMGDHQTALALARGGTDALAEVKIAEGTTDG
jgi:hypothetical protein